MHADKEKYFLENGSKQTDLSELTAVLRSLELTNL